MHQDNHHAHAWLSQVRGRKLYVLCAPQDYALVAPKGRSFDDGGTTREGCFDPLDRELCSQRMAAGLKVYATVLQPGGTIVCPDSWWHYAISLSPSITLMNNFWDAKNKAAVRSMVMLGLKPAKPERSLGNLPPRFTPKAADRPVCLRQFPRVEESPTVAVLRPGEVAAFDVESDGWVRVVESAGSSLAGWAQLTGLKPC